MAYSGFKDSFSKGSTEYFDVCCDPCSTTGVNTEAKGFCTDCQENLCRTCLDAHKKTKASRHHQLLGQSNTKPAKSTKQQHSSTTCTELCQVHQSEVIKFFCPEHDAVGCNDCMTLHRRTCNIMYITDICYNASKSAEFKRTFQDVVETIGQAEKFTKEAKCTKDANKTSFEEAIQEIENFKWKIIARLELLKRTMIQQAQTEITRQDTNVDQAISKVIQISIALKKMESAMKDSQSNIQDARAFVIMKQLQSKMREFNFQSFENNLSRFRIRCIFKPKTGIEDVISSIDGLGKLNVVPDSPKSLTLTETINVRTDSDTQPCDITGCAFLSPDRILLADYKNKKLKILDIVHHFVLEEKTLEYGPFDIVILPQNQAAVTIPGSIFTSSQIIIFNTDRQLSKVRSIKRHELCFGIVYHQDLLYVFCKDPSSLLVLDIQGYLKRHVTYQAFIASSQSSYMNVSHDGQHLYLSAFRFNGVLRITLAGDEIEVYRNDELKGPQQILVLQDGSLLVSCMDSANIYHVSSDLKQGHPLVGSLPGAKSICYHPNSKAFYVGSGYCDQLKVFKSK